MGAMFCGHHTIFVTTESFLLSQESVPCIVANKANKGRTLCMQEVRPVPLAYTRDFYCPQASVIAMHTFYYT